MTTPASKARRKQRKKSREWLDDLIEAQSGQCYWCKLLIVRPRSLANVVESRHGKVFWVSSSGVMFGAKIATVDHIKPLKDGGDNSRQNTVAACLECNRNRNRADYRTPELLAQRSICPKCGGRKPTTRRKCDTCRQGRLCPTL